MPTFPPRSFAALIVTLAFSTFVSVSAQQPIPIRSLFDGKSLAQWEGDPQYWSVRDGSIVGSIPAGKTLDHNTWLVWNGGKLQDFDLRMEVKLSGAPAANSGIQFRCQVDDIHHVSGYQADLDQGAVWLGRIYDEHGRALLVERGSRVAITHDGHRQSATSAPAQQFGVLFRENDWNEYRIVAIGEHIAVYVNGTLFSELLDQQQGECDLEGQLALQLHSGPETHVHFRSIQLEELAADDARLARFAPIEAAPTSAISGDEPRTADGGKLNLGFEAGDLTGWQLTGEAFRDQPVERDGIAERWPGQTSGKQGRYFVGGYERVGDNGVGTLASATFPVTHAYASFLVGGGRDRSTRVEVVRAAQKGSAEEVLFTASGSDQEQMHRVVVDLRPHQGTQIFVRLVDQQRGGWGHLNYDDFRFHHQRPEIDDSTASWRTTQNPLLQHLVPNPTVKITASENRLSAAENTVASMHVPPGFSVQVVAAEPDLHQPMAFTFDERGRLWVVEGHSYPEKRPPGQGLDRVLIFSDTDGDGTFDDRKVFVEGLNLVSGLEVGYGGIWIGAAPELLFVPDQDHDDVPDGEPVVLLDGFGYADTHETLNSFVWGPDGWLYGNQGVFNASRIGAPGAPDAERTALQAGVWRYHPTRHVFEVFGHGGSNQWGLDFDQWGQLFMTHCRSYWGEGLTTHVVQGGHYWNQVNGGYADFVSSVPLSTARHMRNYMLASARYGHGEGGAGKKGSREVYGGHSHVGTMIYLGDNWPDTYRNHLFTHNLHGHQINHQINHPEGSGFNTRHAGYDVLFCGDPQYIGVALKYGPDGAVYITDWYDPRHCHNPDIEQWDRSNGRMYRMQYDATYRPVTVDLGSSSDTELVTLLRHKNDWYARTALRRLAERKSDSTLSATTATQLRELLHSSREDTVRLRALWGLHAIDGLDSDLYHTLLADRHEYLRAWTIQLMLETPPADAADDDCAQRLLHVAAQDRSLVVRRYLASALPRISSDVAWQVAEILARQPENASDRELPLLLWYGIASHMPADLPRALDLASHTDIPALRDYIHWYAAKRTMEGRQAVLQELSQATNEADQQRLLELFELGIRGMRGVKAPPNWQPIANMLYDSPHAATRQLAESVGATFSDAQLFQRMRSTLSQPDSASLALRRHALDILAFDPSPENLPVLTALLENRDLAKQVLPLLTRYNDPQIGRQLLDRLPQWDEATRAAALEVLISRPAWAALLLDRLANGEFPKEQLTAYYARQIFSLGDTALNERLARDWGALGQSSAEKQHEIEKLSQTYQSAPLWAYEQQKGAAHFQKHCATCHNPDEKGIRIGPNLAGTGSKGIRYIVENVIDPSAVIGRDFQARNILVNDGRVITGLIESETDTAVSIRTATNSVTVAKDEIEEIIVSDKSFMPEGLVSTLSELERIELLKYLMSL